MRGGWRAGEPPGADGEVLIVVDLSILRKWSQRLNLDATHEVEMGPGKKFEK
jgi:hypothetical protein